jgi:hypothetical protein
MSSPRQLNIESGSPDRFGYEWKTYAEMVPEYEKQFRGWAIELSPNFGDGRDQAAAA